jgi:phosphoribosylaminoimidazole-succinocarboxamide synthase
MRASKSSKVRNIYEISPDSIVIVTTDRVSAFDIVMPKPIPEKGRILNALSLFWFDFTKAIVPNHVISADMRDMPEYFRTPEFEGRTILAKMLKMLPYECIVRGYMFGHMWEENKHGEYKLAEKLKNPVFTPSAKSEKDTYISFQDMEAEIGTQLANKIKDVSLNIYNTCYEYAYNRGIIIADTKFEFGLDESGNLVLADELLTPDSSRMWDLEEYKIGCSPKSYDKQFLRDWLLENRTGEKKPDIPDEIISKTAALYTKCLSKLTE